VNTAGGTTGLMEVSSADDGEPVYSGPDSLPITTATDTYVPTKAAFTPDTCSRVQVSRTSNLYPDTSGYMSRNAALTTVLSPIIIIIIIIVAFLSRLRS